MSVAADLLIALAPAFLLFFALFAGWHPGERTIHRLASRPRDAARRRAPVVLQPKARAPRALIRAGELIARSLATRPPPAFSNA